LQNKFPRIFSGLSTEELIDMQKINCVSEKNFKKNEVIFKMGDYTKKLGLVKSGSVIIENVDAWGQKSILNHVPVGHVFGETYALAGEMLMVSAIAAEKSDIIFLDVSKITDQKLSQKSWYAKMVLNLLLISSANNLKLSQRIFLTAPKKIRPRLTAYLSSCALRSGKREFDIPFSRQQLADYLNLDRSALSKELSLMQEEGLLKFNKNHFTLLNIEGFE